MNRRQPAADFVDTRSIGHGDVVMAMPYEQADPADQFAAADRADWLLLRLVVCAGLATLVLAVASSLGR